MTWKTWPAYASVAWLVAFVGWHAPLLFGWEPFPATDEVNRAVFVAYDSALIAIAAIGAVVVLATVRPWGRRFPFLLLFAPLAFGSFLLLLRGVPGFVEFLAQVTGLAPAGLAGLLDKSVAAPTGARLWASYAINVYFFLGAVLLTPATVHFWRGARPGAPSGGPGDPHRVEARPAIR
ncbi:hypothetical protein [Actinoplanes sp. L3-i22]|uniref:hypothetical protein n=1 Tax=Actinoplanes sp. L3-i22 TaxID=2836373 RepID=UPI001C75A30C|nr:hypothetical protein [Actinoplanes sp. L3-i22]BCY08946.1 hypothetical protein L3i22_040340 [Actinoplanes sp. L3-i22]